MSHVTAARTRQNPQAPICQNRKVHIGIWSDLRLLCRRRQTTLYAKGAQLIAEIILSRLHPEVTAIGGPVTGADPITGAAVALSAATNRPINGFMVRKAAKGYGAQNWLEGQAGLEQGTSVCVVEDTVTTGGSLIKAIERIEAAGYKVVQCIAVVDREEGARENIEAAGYPFEALTTKRMLMSEG